MSVSQTSDQDTTPKKEVILAHAIATFADEGFRNADVQAIADKAGVGKGTVYRHFGNKEDLFWASSYNVLERLEKQLLAAMDAVEGSLEKLRAIGRAYAQFFEANPQYLEIFVQERAEFRGSAPQKHVKYHEKLIHRFAHIVEQGIAAGELRPVDVRGTIIALAGVLYGSVVHARYAAIDQPLTELAEYAVDIFLRGIRATKPTT
ncbi:MAG: TetR/AcrR family transcriptional regulator [Planctomycetota bacterium]|jgi:AcrR family transcriptional regulator